MTSQEPPLTRREARERERLLHEQAASATPENQTADASSAPVAAPFPPAQAAPRPAANPYAPPAPAVAPAAAPAPAVAPTAAQHPVSAQPVAARPAPVAGPPASTAPVAPAPAVPAAPAMASRTPERTLTRRELRAMLDSHHLDDELDDEGIDDPVAPSAAAASPVAPVRQPVAPPPVVSATPTSVPAAPDASAPRTAPTAPPVVKPVPKATGHWTDQLDVEEVRAEPFDQLLSRGGVSRGVPTTTNALILPTLPDEGQIVSPQATPGEVIVTGSIDLPRSYGATGVHPSQVDSSDIDRLFDNVEDAPTTGVAPVAATRAISTQAAAKQMMMAPPKKDGPNVPLVLAVTAGVLALGVVATLVIGAVFRLF